mmetsp:Transcript_3474/g.10877  ORF Transcript_3474/g.10877 Transcript_3474/m.10877 type:complete len:337 (+) Transcript_3474:556-1566(+)
MHTHPAVVEVDADEAVVQAPHDAGQPGDDEDGVGVRLHGPPVVVEDHVGDDPLPDGHEDLGVEGRPELPAFLALQVAVDNLRREPRLQLDGHAAVDLVLVASKNVCLGLVLHLEQPLLIAARQHEREAEEFALCGPVAVILGRHQGLHVEDLRELITWWRQALLQVRLSAVRLTAGEPRHDLLVLVRHWLLVHAQALEEAHVHQAPVVARPAPRPGAALRVVPALLAAQALAGDALHREEGLGGLEVNALLDLALVDMASVFVVLVGIFFSILRILAVLLLLLLLLFVGCAPKAGAGGRDRRRSGTGGPHPAGRPASASAFSRPQARRPHSHAPAP